MAEPWVMVGSVSSGTVCAHDRWGSSAISGVKEAVWGHQLRGDQPQEGHALSHHSRLIPT